MLALAAATAALASCKETQEEQHFIKVSGVSYSFQPTEADPVNIMIESSPKDWKVESISSWINITGQSENAIELTPDNNLLQTNREGELVITAGEASQTVRFVQVGQQLTPLQSGYKTFGEYVGGAAISPNGIYAGGWYSILDEVERVWIKYVVIENLRTGEVYRLDPFPTTLYPIYHSEAITDSGDIIFHCEDNRGVIFSIDGTIQQIADVNGQHKPWVQHVGSDESGVWVGFCLNAGTLYSPVKWTNGIAEILPKPEETYRGNKPWVQGCMARGCSLDGRKVYGTAWEGLDSGLIWWDENNKPHWISREVREVDMFDNTSQSWYKQNLVDGVLGTSSPYCMSSTGKWIAGTYSEESLNENSTEIMLERYPAFYDTENNQLYTFPEYDGAAGITVTDDGIGVIGLGAISGMTGSTEVIDILTASRISDSTAWIRDNFGIIIPDDSLLEYISPDQKVAFGYDLRGTGGEVMRKWCVFPTPEK